MSLKKKVVWLPYDMDTAIGINNDGKLVFDYQLEDIDYQQGGAPVFNGQDSVIWKNVRAAFFNEIRTMYQNLRSSGALSYEKIERMFEEHQGKWPEAIFNEDSYFKYIAPFVNDNANYLDMLLGSKEEQRKWWLYNRFRYIDSKYIAGDAKDDMIFLRPYVAGDITISPYADIYATIAWDATITQERAARNQTVTLHCPYAEMNGNIVNIYSSSQLKSIGDLSTLKVGQIDIHNATRLQSLKIGDSDSEYENANLYSLTFGNNVLLKSVDVRNCVGFGDTTLQNHTQTTVDMSGCSIIEDVYFTGTKIQSVTLPNGGMVKNLYLPKTITNLTIRNQSKLINFEVEDDDYSNITTLRIENSSSVIPVLDILEQMPGNKTSRVRILGLNMTVSSTQDVEDFYDALDDMRGLDEAGNNTEYPVVQGTITGLGTITGAWLAEMRARYPDIAIEYEHITSNLYYYNGSTLYYTESITDGGNGVYAGTPSKTSDAQYSYTFAGWSLEDDNTVDTDARSHVTADRNVYACYTNTLRTYTVTWVSNGTTIETDSNVPWGTVPHYDGSTPTKDGQTSTGWLPDPTQPITGNTTFTAQYLPVYTVTFKNDTGSTTLDTQNVVQGQTATYGGSTPTSSEDASLAFLGWATSANAHQANAVLTNVQSNMTVYAAFEAGVEVAEITDSWDTIIANIDNGTYSTKYKIGNYKPLDLGTEGTINMQIVAMDADELASGGTAPLTFLSVEGFKGISSAGYSWENENNTHRRYLYDTVLQKIPDTVKKRLQNVIKYTSFAGVTTSNIDKLFVPSSREISTVATFGSYPVETSGVRYSAIYTNNSSRVKHSTASEESISWWIRTFGRSDRQIIVNGTGSGNYASSSADRYLTLGFCLGLEPETITDSWSTILANTNPSASYSIGDTKMIDLGTEGKHLMEIVAFNEDDKADGSGKAKITWLSKTMLNTTHRMNPANSGGAIGTGCTGGWENCEMRTYLKNTIKPLIPETVRNGIVNVTKIQSTVTDGAMVKDGQTTTDDVWIPSLHELNVDSTYETTGAVYNLKFTNANTRKKVSSTYPTIRSYWSRSVKARSDWMYINSDGYRSYTTPQTTINGIALGFCTD